MTVGAVASNPNSRSSDSIVGGADALLRRKIGSALRAV